VFFVVHFVLRGPSLGIDHGHKGHKGSQWPQRLLEVD